MFRYYISIILSVYDNKNLKFIISSLDPAGNSFYVFIFAWGKH